MQPLSQAYLCDLWEFRVDLFSEKRLQFILEHWSDGWDGKAFKPMILTHRLQRDGGRWPDQNWKSRIHSIETILASKLPIQWIDWELECEELLPRALLQGPRSKGGGLLLSHHNFSSAYTLAQYQHLLQQFNEKEADAVKWAVCCQSQDELINLLRFSQTFSEPRAIFNGPACAISMGLLGSVSRALSPILGANWTYGFLGESPIAPGQIGVNVLRKLIVRAQNENLQTLELAKAILRMQEWVFA